MNSLKDVYDFGIIFQYISRNFFQQAESQMCLLISMKECTSVGSQTLFSGEIISLDFKAPSFCSLNRSNHTAQTQTCQATYYVSQLYDELFKRCL
jgi:hypothetical protein